MLKKLFQTENDTAMFIIRVLLGIVYFPHGMQKMIGWFGGPGFSGAMDMFTHQMGIPALFAFLAIMAEGLGSLGLISGFLTRIAALGIGVEMTVAVLMVHLPNGFFMNWLGNQKGEGIEFHILVFALALALILKGGGRWSIDRLIFNKMK